MCLPRLLNRTKTTNGLTGSVVKWFYQLHTKRRTAAKRCRPIIFVSHYFPVVVTGYTISEWVTDQNDILHGVVVFEKIPIVVTVLALNPDSLPSSNDFKDPANMDQ